MSDQHDEQTVAVDAALAWLLSKPGSGNRYIPAHVLRHAFRPQDLEYGNRVIAACVPLLLQRGDAQTDRYYLTLEGLLRATDSRPSRVLAAVLGLIAERYQKGHLDQRAVLWSDIRKRGRFQQQDFEVAWHTILIAMVSQGGGRIAESDQAPQSPQYDYDFWLQEHDLENIAYNATVDAWVALQASRRPVPHRSIQPIAARTPSESAPTSAHAPGPRAGEELPAHASRDPGIADPGFAPALDALHQRFLALGALKDRASAGRQLEALLVELFTLYRLEPASAFRVPGEEIDGSFYFENASYLVEAKWTKDPIEAQDLYAFEGKVRRKSSFTRGVFLSINGYTQGAISANTTGEPSRILLLDGAHLMRVLKGGVSLTVLLRSLIRRLAERGEPYVPISKFRDG